MSQEKEPSTGERSLVGGIWPPCPRCGGGVLPLSDYGHEGAPIIVKAWACMNEGCGYVLRIDKGEVSYGSRRNNGDVQRRRSGER